MRRDRTDNDSPTADPAATTPRRRRAWLVAALVTGGLVLAAGAGTIAAAPGDKGPGFFGPGHGPGGGWMAHHFRDRFYERALDRVDELLEEVDATDEQRERVAAEIDAGIEDMRAMRESHRRLHGRMVELWAAPEIDRDAIESFRQDKIEQMETASRKLTDRLIAIAEALEPEQRAAIAEKLAADRPRRMRHGPW